MYRSSKNRQISISITISKEILIFIHYFRVIFSKVRAILGGRMRLVVAGGAPLSADTHEQIHICLCVKVIQGYGLTETTSCATVMDGNLIFLS